MDFNKLYIIETFVPNNEKSTPIIGYSKKYICQKLDTMVFQDIKSKRIFNNYRDFTIESVCLFTPLSDYYYLDGTRKSKLYGNEIENLVKDYDVFSRKNKIVFLTSKKLNLVEQTIYNKNIK